jgi:hypothetical protein
MCKKVNPFQLSVWPDKATLKLTGTTSQYNICGALYARKQATLEEMRYEIKFAWLFHLQHACNCVSDVWMLMVVILNICN